MGWDVNSSVCSPESILAFFLNVFLYFLLSILVSPATINSIGLSSIKAIVLTICPGLTLWANAASSTDAVDVLCSMISRSGALFSRSSFGSKIKPKIKTKYLNIVINIQSRQANIEIIDGKKYLSFASNDYLGMSNNYELQEALSESCKKNGLGSGSSPLISGYSESHKELECLISEFLGTQSTIIFSSGYQTNVGVIKSISEPTDHILIDKLDHASIVDGTLFSKAKFKRYSHNNISDLNEKVNESDKDIIVCVDSLFSMDGDFAKLNEIQKIKKDKDFYLLVDEAHALGVYGSGGRGLCNEMNIPMNEMVGITGTFGKSFGTFGAFFSGSQDVVNFVLQNYYKQYLNLKY